MIKKLNILFLIFSILGSFVICSNSFAVEIEVLGEKGTRYPIPKGKFPKWDEMLSHWNHTQGLVDDECEPGLFSICFLKELQELTEQLKSQDDWEKIILINTFVNQIRYREDIQTYGINDYWAIPQEFFDNEMGDCEDYSLSKYYALKAAGIKIDNLQIAVVKDVNIGIHHAILIVKHDGKNYVLDNRLDQVVAEEQLRHYKMIYTINEKNWWFF